MAQGWRRWLLALVAGVVLLAPPLSRLATAAPAPPDPAAWLSLRVLPPAQLHAAAAEQGGDPMLPATLRAAYHLPANRGAGRTIAVVVPFAYPTVRHDLDLFSRLTGLGPCTTAERCLAVHPMAARLAVDPVWAQEAALDVEWAHAIAPRATVLLVEAASDTVGDLLDAVDYARSTPGVVAVSMSWGAPEFAQEVNLESHFSAANGGDVAFFAAAGDDGHGVEWPAVSPQVTGVGGTTLQSGTDGGTLSESAWRDSGGGRSVYFSAPVWQARDVLTTGGRRGVPDVGYAADPTHGYLVLDSVPLHGLAGWLTVGGTSAGAPQWAAIAAIDGPFHNTDLYSDATSRQAASLFRDITSGTNGTCGRDCTAGPGYDLVTGLGTPRGVGF